MVCVYHIVIKGFIGIEEELTSIYVKLFSNKLSINSTLNVQNPMQQSRIIFLSIIAILAVVNYGLAYGLTESIDVFGQINSADIILNDIWIEPKNPEKGQPVSIHGSVYNTGIISTGQITDVVTIGYFVNGELVEISLLEDIQPGLENGVEISSGPLFDAVPGNYIITGIINYHDTLSHLRDNPENNIVQRMIQIGNEVPLIIDFDVFQNYVEDKASQVITVKGKITDIFQGKASNQKITVNVGEHFQKETTTDRDGVFDMKLTIPFNREIIEIAIQNENNLGLLVPPQQVLPIKIGDKESALSLAYQEFDDIPLTVVIFQDSYDNLFQKVTTNDSIIGLDGNVYPIILPAGHEYIFEIYFEGRIIDAFQRYFKESQVISKEIPIRESAQIQFRIIDEFGEPQNNVKVSNWIYDDITNEDGITSWMDVFPTFSDNEPYVAKAIFPDDSVSWSEKFHIQEGEKKVIQMIKRGGMK